MRAGARAVHRNRSKQIMQRQSEPMLRVARTGRRITSAFTCGLNESTHHLTIRAAWLAARRSEGGGDEAMAAVAPGADLGAAGEGALYPRDRARDGGIPPQRDALPEPHRGRQAAAAKARRALSFCH